MKALFLKSCPVCRRRYKNLRRHLRNVHNVRDDDKTKIRKRDVSEDMAKLIAIWERAVNEPT